MKTNLKKLLGQTSKADLRMLVLSLYGLNNQVDSFIEATLLASDPTELAKHIKKQVQSINRGSRFIDYNESLEFSNRLDQVVEQIESLLPENPKSAFELVDLFMGTHRNVYERCDDSNGYVGDSYRAALQVWISTAAEWQKSNQPCKLDWSVEIRDRHYDNDYAVWDYLISCSLPLLGGQSLRELGEYFEAEAKQLRSVDSDGYNINLARASIGVKGVAEALGDIAMYERSHQIGMQQELNDIQKEDIAKFCLAQKDADSALKWLAGEWRAGLATRQQELVDLAYVMLGRSDDLLQLRQKAYKTEPSFKHLQALLEVVSESERDSILADATDHASASDNILLAVDTLMKLQNMDAAAMYVLENQNLVETVSYYHLVEWVKIFEECESNVAAVLVYRVLLLEILRAGRTKAYRHAAKYYKALDRLDSDTADYCCLMDKADFDQQLVAIHGKKRSFWALVS